MKSHAPAQLAKQPTPAAPARPAALADTTTLADRRAEAPGRRSLQELALDSPQTARNKALLEVLHDSPRALRLQAIRDSIQRGLAMPARRIGLPDDLKAGVEALSGMDMAHVRVHYNSPRPAQLGAHAYAQGNEIHVAPGQERHLPHEAWHVVQQAQGRVRPTMRMPDGVPVNAERGLEREADVMGASAMQLTGGQAPVPAALAGVAPAPRAGRAAQRAARHVTVQTKSARAGNGMPMPGAGAGVIQCFQAQIIATEDRDGHGVIADIKLSGRTATPFFGTMGAHSTAWTVHTDGIRRQLQGLTLDRAIARMRELLRDEVSSPAATSIGLNAGHQTHVFGPGAGLAAARLRVEALSQAGYTGADEAGKTAWLEDFIDAYLDLVNRLPLATVQSGSKDGDNEGGARNVLIPIEGGGREDPAVIRQAFALLFATDTPAAFVRDTPFKVQPADPDEVWAVGLYTFLRGLRHAYPIAYEMAGLDKLAVLEDFLLTLHHDVPANIMDRLAALEGAHKPPPLGPPPREFLQGGGGDITGGDLAVQVRFSKAGNVEAVRMEGRTPSPFVGSMGAHSTAWIAHLDAVRRSLTGQNLQEAIETMLVVSGQAQTSPLLKLVPLILPDQARLLARAQVELEYFQRVIQEKGASELIQKTRLQQLIAAYLQFENALPLHTSEAAGIGGHAEGTHRENLRAFETGELKAIKAQSGKKGRKGITLAKRLEQAFWGLYDPASVAAFIENLFPTPLSLASTRQRGDGRSPRAVKKVKIDPAQTDNELKEKARVTAYQQKPVSEGDKDILSDLGRGASDVQVDGASVLLPQAMALASFLHTMEAAYPLSYAAAWGKFGTFKRIGLISDHLDCDGQELLDLMETLPARRVVQGASQSDLSSEKKTGNSGDLNGKSLIDVPAHARRDGIAAQYVVGRASGTWNACLIFSLLRHALGRDATNHEVTVIRTRLANDHADIRQERQINIYSPTGHAVIRAIEEVHHVSLNVAVVTTREAPVVPVSPGVTPALLYLMPGHFVPCWRRG